jgi:hypothetical protein
MLAFVLNINTIHKPAKIALPLLPQNTEHKKKRELHIIIIIESCYLFHHHDVEDKLFVVCVRKLTQKLTLQLI